MPRSITPLVLFGALLGTTAPLAGIGGCTPHARYPAIEGDAATEDLNMLPSPIVMRLSLARVADRHLGGVRPYAIDFPPAVSDQTGIEIAQDLGEDVQVAWEASPSVPVIRISRVWILGDTALVDVERPVMSLNSRQTLTVRLRSDIRGWRVDGVRSWPVGLDLAPDRAHEPDLEYETVPADEPAPTETSV